MDYFLAYVAPDEKPEEGAEAVVTPRDFKALTVIRNTTKNTDTEKQASWEDILYSFLEKIFDQN